MPKYEVTDNQTGKKYQLEGDSPPTEQELNDIFASQREDNKSVTTTQGEPLVAESKPLGGSRVLDTMAGMVETPLALATGAVGGLAGLAGSIGAGLIGKSPDEAKKFREFVSDYYTYHPKSESGKGAVGLAGIATTPLSIPRKIGESIGGEQWGNIGDVAMLGLAPKVPGAVRAVRNLPYKAGEFIYRKGLTPKGTVAETKAMTNTGFEKGYSITEKGQSRFYKDLDVLKQQANRVIAKNQGKTIPYQKVLAPLDELITDYAKNTEIPTTNTLAIERIKTQLTREWLKDYPDGNIPVEKVQKLKTTLYKRAENAYGEVKVAMAPEARKALARGARQELEAVMPEIGTVNRNMKPLLEFEDALDSAIVRLKNEKFSITNTIFNNDYLLGKLAMVFRAISPKHPLANPATLRVQLKTASPATIDFDEAFPKDKFNPKQIEYKPPINLGMTDVSGQPSSYTPPLIKPTMRALGFDRATTPINLGMSDESSVRAIKGTFNNPEFWKKNSDLTASKLKIQNGQPLPFKEWNTLLERIMLGNKTNPRIPLKGE